jgi:hypothetical protein
VLAGLLPQITIINGRHDRVVPLPNAEFLDQRLPTSRLVIIDAGHFVWEEAPAKYASARSRATGHDVAQARCRRRASQPASQQARS